MKDQDGLPSTVKLTSGAVEAFSDVRYVMRTLKQLHDEHPEIFREFVTMCREPGTEVSPGSREILASLRLIRSAEPGTPSLPSTSVHSITLACVAGEIDNLSFVYPLQRRKAR